jgi:aminopeptidase N
MVKFLLVCCTFLFVFTSGAQVSVSGGHLKPEQAVMDIRHYTLSLEVSPETQSYKGFTEITLNLLSPSPLLIFNLDNRFTISKIAVNGKQQSFKHENGLISIPGSPDFPSGKLLVKIDYGGKPMIAKNPPWDGGIQWTTDSLGRPWIAMSCQSDGAQIFFPCKDHPSDEPNEGADLIITVPKGLVVAGPGLLIKTSTSGNKSTFHWKTNYTISNYCILFNAGYYKLVSRSYTTVLGNKVPMQYYVLDYNQPKADKLLDLFERSTHMLEKYFGEYPWVKEKIAIAETPHLGMEHQTMIAYGNKYRYTKVGNVDFDWLLQHEFGHEWWANKVSNKDWAHMWIQEGICSFGDALFYQDFGGRQAYLDRMKNIAIHTQNKLPVVQGVEVDSRQTYQPDIYGKGAFFMHTLRYVIGDSIFFPALKGFATDPKYTYDNMVTTEDVMNYFNTASRKNLKPLFDLFLYTTDRLTINIKQTGLNTYLISFMNMDMTLPLEVQTSAGRQKLMVNKTPVEIKSDSLPVIDPDCYYLKKIVIE